MVTVVGLGLGADSLTPEVQKAVKKAEVLAGAERHLALFAESTARRLKKADLEKFLDEIVTHSKTSHVVVLASGDPGFYGVAWKLAQRLPEAEFEIICNISSFQAAFARLKLSWVGAQVVCMHGGRIRDLFPALIRSDQVAVLNDHLHTPARVAELLLQRGQDKWQAWVLEDLGMASEKVNLWELEQIKSREFAKLSMMVLLRKGLLPVFTDPELGREIRAAVLANLDLHKADCFWDVFNPDPYMALCASRRLWQGGVVAFHSDPEKEKDLKLLCSEYGAANLEVTTPGQSTEGLKQPGAIHVAGERLRSQADLKSLWLELGPGGVLAVSCRKETQQKKALAELGALTKNLRCLSLAVGRARPDEMSDSCFLCLAIKA
ncbi:precorrin-6y C5,15-methyltransferase (decarboxylating) subunit CbiE [Dethiosulfatarculus sandiegensis]|uniref:Tetrapyrrole methylase domain-containing protein n=1 Tax=Dethiosulfatarculus sandiegensis TaxID=1429043 RepID=A0A0D2J3F9_9BACT|nr:precorrin-6y C5,15-methyltransferase (decarboxylating) subunit CbiE [Dethiosulfatarculus sandiegensis]KIX12734.1 hypothetical protein X474_17730 [Dethiosulfatarculus sandiegensis]